VSVSPQAEIFQILKQYNRFMLGCHLHPDGDAIGSLMALGISLEKTGKEVRMVCPEGIPSVFRFLEGSERVVRQPEEGFEPEVVIALDCADRARLSLPNWPLTAILINIDHHITNTGFGHVSLVQSDAAATGEIVYDLIGEGGLPLPQAVASAIFTAIATDTGFFRFPSTSGKILRLAATLMEDNNVSLAQIAEQVHDEKSFDSLKLLAEVLSTLTVGEDRKVAWMVLSQEMLNKYKAELEETESFVNYARSVSGVEVGLLFKELEPGDIKVSWRSGASVDVSKLAAEFGGGGHARAAGCTLKKTLKEATDEVLGFIHEWYQKNR
jgi:phosphoesterase RecJ-like protein